MDISSVRAQFERELAAAASEADLRALRDRYLARKGGLVSTLLKDVASAPPDQRPGLGRDANLLKQHIEETLKARLAEAALSRPVVDAIDVTLPGRAPLVGHRHPLTLLRERVEEIFLRMGFFIAEGPELEDDYHNFEALNMPAEHPARDMQDTLYLAAPLPVPGGRAATLLRTHTSGMQIRYMEAHQPPVRLIAPGRVYRRDGLDLTHSPMFTQVEGLAVDRDISFADLKGVLLHFVKRFYGKELGIRLRPSYFPFVEPGAEVDMQCSFCMGSGCRLCKGTGWLEIGGSGMVDPEVFANVGIDSEKYTGFAFGMGLERMAMLRHNVTDIKFYYEGDVRFLEQF